MTKTALDRGCEALQREEWLTAFEQLSAAEAESSLEPQDLQSLSTAAYLLGKETEATEYLSRAHQAFLAEGQIARAARCAFWLGFFAMFNRGMAQAGGWFARARRLLEEAQLECVERGYLLIPEGIRLNYAGEAKASYEIFIQAAKVGEKFADKELLAFARLGQGRSLIRCGEIERGVSLLDEAMVAVTSGEVSPLAAGGVYCAVIEACGEIFDLRRAHEWTTALQNWCASKPDMVPYRGHCLIRRAEVLQLHGEWTEALAEAQRACERMEQPMPKPGVAVAFYRLAEIHRLRGEFEDAERAYRQASQWSPSPQPGMALLRLSQGQMDAAVASIRHAAAVVQEPSKRAPILEAHVEITLAANDIAAASAASAELAKISEALKAPLLEAMAARAGGAVQLANGSAGSALVSLRKAFMLFHELEAPYEAARARELMGLACRQQKNIDGADLELAAAREVFAKLGAKSDVERVDGLRQRKRSNGSAALTTRELEVLKLIASGRTNRAIADHLAISEKTVARHVSNIFIKLDLTSRAAATAYAYKNGLV